MLSDHGDPSRLAHIGATALDDVDRLLASVPPLQWDNTWLPQVFKPATQYPGAERIFRDDVELPVLFYGREKVLEGRRADMIMADVGLEQHHEKLVERLCRVRSSCAH